MYGKSVLSLYVLRSLEAIMYRAKSSKKGLSQYNVYKPYFHYSICVIIYFVGVNMAVKRYYLSLRQAK